MTPEQRAFEAALLQRLRDRAALILSTEGGVVRELQALRDQVVALLATQPADWQQLQLSRILDQVQIQLDGAAGRATAIVDGGLRQAWQQGEDFIDKPLAAGGINVELQLPVLDTQVLVQLRRFTALSLNNVASEAASRIGRQLSLVTIGAQTPQQAINEVQAQLGSDSPRRATTIVRTEVGRAFALASEQRMEQAVELVPGLQKQWRRSGKIHSRWNHDAIDGQVVDVTKPFVLPSGHGPVRMMHPHDPAAPIEEVINCGCIALPFMKSWKDAMSTLGAKPFSERELALDGRKAQLDQAAKRAGLRQS